MATLAQIKDFYEKRWPQHEVNTSMQADKQFATDGSRAVTDTIASVETEDMTCEEKWMLLCCRLDKMPVWDVRTCIALNVQYCDGALTIWPGQVLVGNFFHSFGGPGLLALIDRYGHEELKEFAAPFWPTRGVLLYRSQFDVLTDPRKGDESDGGGLDSPEGIENQLTEYYSTLCRHVEMEMLLSGIKNVRLELEQWPIAHGVYFAEAPIGRKAWLSFDAWEDRERILAIVRDRVWLKEHDGTLGEVLSKEPGSKFTFNTKEYLGHNFVSFPVAVLREDLYSIYLRLRELNPLMVRDYAAERQKLIEKRPYLAALS